MNYCMTFTDYATDFQVVILDRPKWERRIVANTDPTHFFCRDTLKLDNPVIDEGNLVLVSPFINRITLVFSDGTRGYT